MGATTFPYARATTYSVRSWGQAVGHHLLFVITVIKRWIGVTVSFEIAILREIYMTFRIGSLPWEFNIRATFSLNPSLVQSVWAIEVLFISDNLPITNINSLNTRLVESISEEVRITIALFHLKLVGHS
jgi:hypothetical protein